MKTTTFATCSILFIGIATVIESKKFICDQAHYRFQCEDGDCVSIHSRCDFKQDCSDGSDEKGCDYPTCAADDFVCKNGRCIPQHWICDDSDDCYDNSDEDKQLCANHSCPADKFQCKGSKACYSMSWRCDGHDDCDEGDDEIGCPQRECTADEFVCANKECVESTFVCDGEEDCKDGSDEEECEIIECKANQFKCKKHPQCISKNWLCDNTYDCRDHTDEEGCEVKTPICPAGYFACTSGSPKCLPTTWKCDGNPECSDGSDELHCDKLITRCSWDQFHCHNRRQCISSDRRCDGARDCIDSSDEIDCPSKAQDKTKCPATTHFQCPDKDKTCIPNHSLCDNVEDCPGGEDEVKGPHYCDYDECSANNGNCSHICTNLRVGWQCGCPTGYRLGDDKLTCEDIDECDKENSMFPCSEFCFNSPGSYRCACWEGYELVHSTGECKPLDKKNDVVLIYTAKDHINTVDKSRISYPGALAAGTHIGSISIDFSNDYVYWADKIKDTITRSKVVNNEVVLKRPAIRDPGDLAVDWVHSHLYWVDSNMVWVSNVDGTYTKCLYRRETSVILSIAVHPKLGFIYISSVTKTNKHPAETKLVDGVIERCSMAGAEDSCGTVVEVGPDGYPIDMAIDYELDLLYWVDLTLQALSVSDLDGNHKRLVVYLENFTPFSLAVFAGKVYMATPLEEKIISVNRTGGNLQVVAKIRNQPIDIEVWHARAQPMSTNYCAGSPCKFMCLPTAHDGSNEQNYTCVCPDGYVKKDDDANDCKATATTTTLPTTTAERQTSPIQTTNHGVASMASTEAAKMSTSAQVLIAIGIIAIFVIGVFLLCYVYQWRKQQSVQRSMNFNNPIYRKVESATGSRSSITALDGQSLNDSESEVTLSGSGREMTAQLVLNEELPEGSGGTTRPSKQSNGGTYVKVANHEIEYAGMSSNR